MAVCLELSILQLLIPELVDSRCLESGQAPRLDRHGSTLAVVKKEDLLKPKDLRFMYLLGVHNLHSWEGRGEGVRPVTTSPQTPKGDNFNKSLHLLYRLWSHHACTLSVATTLQGGRCVLWERKALNLNFLLWWGLEWEARWRIPARVGS